MKELLQKKAYIFDLDGTLADSMHVWDSIARQWLTSRNLVPEKNLEAVILDMTLWQSAEYIIYKYTLDRQPQQVIDEWMDMVLLEYAERIPLKQGVQAFLQQSKARGKRMVIATSCFPKACTEFLKRTGIQPFFEEISFTDETKKDKTHPDIYLLSANRLGVKPEDCVVFEDSYSALRGIRKAGMQAIAVYDSCCTSWKDFTKQADGFILSFTDLLTEYA